MENNPKTGLNIAAMNLGPLHFSAYFISHLDKIYSAKAHLVERLPEIETQVYFSELNMLSSKPLKTLKSKY